MSKLCASAFLVVSGCLLLPKAASGLICETLGPAISQFDQVVAEKFVTKPRSTPGGVYSYGCSGWGFVGGDSCSTRAQFKQGEFYTITATRPTGTAIRFRSGGEYECRFSRVDDVYTGGGAARLSDDIEPDSIDTTGTHPSVAACAAAIDAASAASGAFAAMAPVQTFDKVRVEPGDTFRIDVPGGGVVNIGELKLGSAPVRPDSGYRYGECYFGDGAALVVDSGGGEVVINVDRLDLGNCAWVEVNGPGLLFNVPGRGRKVRVGVQAFEASDQAEILAPGRVVSVRGGRTESSTSLGGVFARKLISIGYVFAEEPYCG